MLREVTDDNLLCDDDMGVGTSVIDTGDQPASTSTSDVSSEPQSNQILKSAIFLLKLKELHKIPQSTVENIMSDA